MRQEKRKNSVPWLKWDGGAGIFCERCGERHEMPADRISIVMAFLDGVKQAHRRCQPQAEVILPGVLAMNEATEVKTSFSGERACPECQTPLAYDPEADAEGTTWCPTCKAPLHVHVIVPEGDKPDDWRWVECDGAGCWCQELGD